eukprot:TRINITY_DN5708_c0_g3_i1.p1 TRINITY_DN5708_c0_g3~~TRINITY_DN5708_c0_g3_i1.p1  ORF type:complete len:230 (+),score=77.87 TRINITY_DN5708_c0_g3_i1:89-691(+)
MQWVKKTASEPPRAVLLSEEKARALRTLEAGDCSKEQLEDVVKIAEQLFRQRHVSDALEVLLRVRDAWPTGDTEMMYKLTHWITPKRATRDAKVADLKKVLGEPRTVKSDDFALCAVFLAEELKKPGSGRDLEQSVCWFQSAIDSFVACHAPTMVQCQGCRFGGECIRCQEYRSRARDGLAHAQHLLQQQQQSGAGKLRH